MDSFCDRHQLQRIYQGLASYKSEYIQTGIKAFWIEAKSVPLYHPEIAWNLTVFSSQCFLAEGIENVKMCHWMCTCRSVMCSKGEEGFVRNNCQIIVKLPSTHTFKTIFPIRNREHMW